MSLPLPANTMDPDQRARLVRTARKLEALLGTTPQVVGSNDFFRKTKKKHDVYVSHFSSSASSLDSTASEKDHVGRARPDVRDVFSERSTPYLPRSGNKLRGARQPLAQPVLLRMSAVPADHRRRQSTGNALPPRPAIPFHAPTPAPPLVTPSERRKLKVDSVLGQLSPFNKSHFPAEHHSHSRSHSDLDLPLTPSSSSPPDAQNSAALTGLSDRERRVKMAKVQRMMGEHIPQELVFRESRTVEKTPKTHKRRSRSMSAIRTGTATTSSRETLVDTKSKGKDTARPLRPLPILPIASPRSLPPTPLITQTTTTTTTTTPLLRQLSLTMKRKTRKTRPRSLNLGNASAFVTANLKIAAQQEKPTPAAAASAVVERAEPVRGTVSLDESRHWPYKSGGGDKAFDQCPDMPFAQEMERIKNIGVFRTELWRRKEREWSGEWNVRDMDEVARALRGLKAT